MELVSLMLVASAPVCVSRAKVSAVHDEVMAEAAAPMRPERFERPEREVNLPGGIPSARSRHRTGVFASAIPAGFGLNLAYNALDFLRVHAGAGNQIATGGLQFLLPKRGFTPVVGGGAHQRLAKTDPFVSGGLDWQAESGFNLGVSYEYLPRVAESQPSVRLGWYF